MKHIRKTLALLLVLTMLFALAPAGLRASAEETTPALVPVETVPQPEETTPDVDPQYTGIPTITGSGEIPFQLNPLYEGILTADHFPKADFSAMQGETSSVQSDYVSEADAALQVREYMVNRTSYYTINVSSPDYDAWTMFDELLAEAMAHNGNPREGDCLQWQYGGWEASYSYYYSNSTYHYSFDIYMPYYTTAAQEAELDTAVANLLSQLNLWNKTDYEKVCGVYDYICDNVVYDYEHLNDESYELQYTAYGALVNKTSVCQGYAVLFYRLMLELGVDARVIVGDGGGPHAWNIVELDDLYYNLDSTWDAGMPSYSYFLQSPRDFLGHTRDPEYETAEFHAAYPMSATSYGKEPEVIEATPITLDTWYAVYINTANAVAYYSFTPAESGYYNMIASSGGYDTRCSLYDSGWSMVDSDDDGGEGYDFSLTAWLDAGETYYFGVDFYGTTTGGFQILLTIAEGEDSGPATPSGKIENNIAAAYQVSDLVLDADGIYRTPDGRVVYIAVDNSGDGGLTWLFGYTLKNYVDEYGSDYFDMSDWEALVTLMDSDGYVVLTEETLQYLITTITGNPNWGETEEHVMWYLFYDSISGGEPDTEIIPLTLDESTYVDLGYGSWATCSFTPSESGYYALNAYSDDDTYCNLYDGNWNYMFSNDDGGQWKNFRMNAYLEAGEVYYYEFFFYWEDVSGTVEVTLTRSTAPAANMVQNMAADQYAISDLVLGSDGIYRTPTGYTVYIAVDNWEDGGLRWLNDDTLYDCVEYSGSTMFDLTCWYDLVNLMDSRGYVVLTETTLQYLITTITGNPEWQETADYAAKYLFFDISSGDGTDPEPEPEPELVVTPLALDQYTTATITVADTCAYYSFTPAESGYYDLTAYSNGCDTYGFLVDADWNWIDDDDDGGPDLDFSLEYWLEAGVTYIYGVRFYSSSYTGSFQILLTYTGSGEVVITPLTLDQTVTVSITTGGSYAYYSFTPDADGFYTLTAFSGEDTVCNIYDGDGNYLDGNDDGGEGLDFSLICYLEAGTTYYYEVFYYDKTAGSFQMILTEENGETPSGKIENNITGAYAVSDLELGEDGIYRTPEGGTVYIGINNYNDGGLYWLGGNTLYDYVDYYGSECFDMSCWDALVSQMDSDGYVVLTDETLQYLITTIAGNPEWGETEGHVVKYLFYDPAPVDTEYVLGDVNNDGEIDILDANLVVTYYNEIVNLTEEQLLAADVNSDGEVDIMDANMIVAYYNEIIDSFPAQQ